MRTILALPSTPLSSSGEIAWPLMVQGRGIVDQNGQHMFFASHGGAQNMIQLIASTDYELWFSNAQANGFNSVIITFLGAALPPTHPAASNGTPFTGTVSGSPDFTTPRESYFALLDMIIDIAASHEMIAILDPDPYHQPVVVANNGVTRCRTFGQWLGTRYAGKPNIVWLSGNDYAVSPGSAQDNGFRAIAQGIKDIDKVHLHSLWTQHERNNTVFWTDIVDFFTIYEYEPTYNGCYINYNNTTKPIMPIEFVYEGETQGVVTGNPRLCRKFAWDASPITGTIGSNFGDPNWMFPSNWKTLMTSLGNRQGGLCKKGFDGRTWWNLVPDQDHAVVTAGYGTYAIGNANMVSDDYAPAARTLDGSLIMLYMPTARTITVDMTKTIDGVTAKWYNPETGETVLGDGPLTNTGTRTFTPPSRTGDSDWAFILEL